MDELAEFLLGCRAVYFAGSDKIPTDHIKTNIFSDLIRSHIINTDAGFAYIVHTVHRHLVKQIVSIIDCRVFVRYPGMRLPVHEFHTVV